MVTWKETILRDLTYNKPFHSRDDLIDLPDLNNTTSSPPTSEFPDSSWKPEWWVSFESFITNLWLEYVWRNNYLLVIFPFLVIIAVIIVYNFGGKTIYSCLYGTCCCLCECCCPKHEPPQAGDDQYFVAITRAEEAAAREKEQAEGQDPSEPSVSPGDSVSNVGSRVGWALGRRNS